MNNRSSRSSSRSRASRIPRDTDFRQQRLKAWRPLCTGQKLTGCFFLTGLLFVAVGALLVWDASTVVQVEVEYDEQCCVENCNGVGVRRDMNPCFVNISVDKDMDGPVYLFYELREFYQNNRLVVNSRDDAQLKGFSRVPNDLECRDDTMFAVDGHLKNDFTQEYTVESDFNTMANEISPCGLMAYAFFNDTLEIGAGTSGADWTRLTTQYSDAIAWSSEDGTGWPNEKQFENAVDGSTGNNFNGFAEWKQRACSEKVDVDLHSTIAEPGRLGDFSTPEDWVSACRAAQLSANQTDEPWDGVSDDFPSTPGWCFKGSGYCAEDPHFMVWMRTSALVPFRKLHAKIEGTLRKGTYLAKIYSGQQLAHPDTCDYNDPLADCYFRPEALNLSESKSLTAETLYASSTAEELDSKQKDAFENLRSQWTPARELFPAYHFGSKSIVLSTAGRVGGKNYTLGVMYLVWGVVLAAVAIVFRIKLLWNARPLGTADFLYKQQVAARHHPASSPVYEMNEMSQVKRQ